MSDEFDPIEFMDHVLVFDPIDSTNFGFGTCEFMEDSSQNGQWRCNVCGSRFHVSDRIPVCCVKCPGWRNSKSKKRKNRR